MDPFWWHHSQKDPNEIVIDVQGCFVIQLSNCSALSAKAFIFYHTLFPLSRTFFKSLTSLFRFLYVFFFSTREPVKGICEVFLTVFRATLIWYRIFILLSRVFYNFHIFFLIICTFLLKFSYALLWTFLKFFSGISIHFKWGSLIKAFSPIECNPFPKIIFSRHRHPARPFALTLRILSGR